MVDSGVLLSSAADIWIMNGTGTPVGDAGANRGVSSLYLQSDGVGGPALWVKIGVADVDWAVPGGSSTATSVLESQVFAPKRRAHDWTAEIAATASDGSHLIAVQSFGRARLAIAAQLQKYLPLAGGTLTGTLTAGGGFSTFGSTANLLYGKLQLLSQGTPNLVANTNNLATGNVFQLVVSQTAAWNLSGLVAQPGMLLLVTNVSAFNLTLTEEDVLSTAVNRFSTGQALGLTLIPNYSVFVHYDSTTTRWRTVRYV